MLPARTRNCASTFLLSSLLLLLSCQERTTQKAPGQKAAIFEEQDLDVLSLSVRHADLGGLVAIREEDYFSLVAFGDFAAADATVREQQLSLAASANAASALGLVGTLEAGVSLNDKRVVVLHNPRKVGDDGRHQATSFSVVGGRLFGSVGWALVAPQLHFSELDDDDCARPYRGCAVLIPPDMRPHAFSNWEEGGMGLPPEYRLDAESAIGPQNRVGRMRGSPVDERVTELAKA